MSSINLHMKTLGIASTNCYLVADAATQEAVCIDPVDDAPTLLAWAEELGLTIRMIVATHAHFDHVLASHDLKAATDAPFVVHTEAAPLLARLPETGLRFVGTRFPEAAVPDRLVEDGEVFGVGPVQFTALYTPGHAPGHISLHMPQASLVFSGDALFAGTVGRTDIPGADHATLLQSIHTRLLTLPDDTRVFPGHGRPTTIGAERATNPFLQRR